METRLLKLQSDFNNIITIRTRVKNIFDTLQVKINKLHQIHSEFIKNNKNDLFVFGLDSFHFQSKLIDIEYDDMKRLFLAINNRMYCEYFKLHKIIVDYICKNVNDKKAINLIKFNKYPIYKDLEPFKEYKFEIISDIHENIINLLNSIITMLNTKENELSIHITKKNIGLNIDNFITTFNFNINVMREKVVMFITYIEFFHKMHTKYLKRFSNKIELVYTHINNDIRLDDTVEISKNKKRELINELLSNNPIDKELLNELKTSIGSESNSENFSDISKSSSTSNLSINYEKDKNNSSNINTVIENSAINKKDYKSLFKKNVHKVTNILQLFKHKNNNIEQSTLYETDLQNIFSDINKSCDSIIDSNENIGLNIEFIDSKNNKNESISFDTESEDKTDSNYFDFNKHQKSFKYILKDIAENEILKQQENVIEMEDNKEVVELDKTTREEVNPEIAIEQPATKQKRKYNRKKKV
jgi:hypothetical protein